ncbi:type VI secretion system baseplate subunit TssE [Photobacterium sanguinicancri]|uniref:Type VI secretion system baseplate subunit TssE n=1 Tax=Photobacterium sanguinicancri TaxID=875932 RepID=A0AAW7Y463_9GAMM|nr:type VI secretion system baseplate subunit TssE [Photobacterium sanguinicancri]MDO6496736.1 type VI secretion system baseplate subunit TssE [Photobacterium sanguinicancri]MDO6543383.1 type VI secretion system baseplate subunit TssE [Photobacterium sanguinicancri]OZS44092.1 hypothetical protein ASV53_09945 [Photobacterium sanguinicancri]
MSLLAKMKGEWHNDVDSVRDAIIENLSSLLSSRAPIWGAESLLIQSRDSIATFGMATAMRAQNRANSTVVLHEIKHLIQVFEPRLKHVDIELDEASIDTNKLKFRIEGSVTTDFGEDVVVFDSSLDFTTSSLDVRKTNLV